MRVSDSRASRGRSCPTEEGMSGTVVGGGPEATVPAASRVVALGFAVVLLSLLSLPLVLLPLVPADTASEKRDLAPVPALTTEEGLPNLDILSDVGAWFDDHFAFRSEMIDLDATLRESVLGTSATQNVVVGRDGWLFYTGTLADYRRSDTLSVRALENVAWNLSLMQEHVRSRGKSFVVAIVPNKNSLYADLMPYYELAGTGPSNLERLLPLLEEHGVAHVDLREVLSAADHPVYLARDSHWTNEGALMGYGALMDVLGRAHDDYAGSATSVEGHEGDLDLMLHPVNPVSEGQELWEDSERFSFTNEATSVEDSLITTESEVPGAEGRLLAYRDSFGNALLPYLATAYAEASFTKMVPYDMGDAALQAADDVIVERAERHLSFFASDPPYLPAPERKLTMGYETRETKTTVRTAANGPYLTVEGDLEEGIAGTWSPILVATVFADGTERVFEAFHVGPSADVTADRADGGQDEDPATITTDWGYRAYLPLYALDGAGLEEVRILVPHDGSLTSVASTAVTT